MHEMAFANYLYRFAILQRQIHTTVTIDLHANIVGSIIECILPPMIGEFFRSIMAQASVVEFQAGFDRLSYTVGILANAFAYRKID